MTDPTTETVGPAPAARTRFARWTRPLVLIPVGAVLLVLFGAAALAFQPWKLVLDQTVDEPVPVPAAAGPAHGADGGSASKRGTSGPITVRSGSFIGHEHDTVGRAQILELADGHRILRLEHFRTSNGPDLKVWLTGSQVIDGRDGWFVFDDDKYVDLGPLKGNVGNQNYVIPSDVELDDIRSVAIWCDRFNVSFGAAELAT